MNIGIDIDGVLMDDDTYRLDTMSKFGYENNIGVLDYPYAFESKCNWDKEMKQKYKEEYYFDYIKNMPAKRYASEVIEKLHKEGHKIIIITGRTDTQEDTEIGRKIRNYTEEWLRNNNIYYDKICYAYWPKTKEIQENNIDVMIEDSDEVINEIAKYTKVFCYDNRYNIDLQSNNVVRVFSWYDIYAKIKSI